MPELPEVQTIVSDLKRKLTRHKITGIWTDWNKSFKNTVKNFKAAVLGKKVIRIRRRAKNILIDLTGGKTIMIHLKMTGHLLYRDSPLTAKRNVIPHVRTIFTLDKNKELAFSDLRRFGEIYVFDTNQENNIKRLANLGPEPLDKEFIPEILNSIVKKRSMKIKALLMDQNIISGIGNIYADEILWTAKIHPCTLSDKLNKGEISKLYYSVKNVLNIAIKKRGSSISDYKDTEGKSGYYQKVRKAYGRKGESCKHCGNYIIKIKVINRGTYFCPYCQKIKN